MEQLALIAALAFVSACSAARQRASLLETSGVQDVAPPENTVVIRLEYATAQDVRDVLDQIFNASKRQYGCALYEPGLVCHNELDLDPRIVSDERTNTITLAIDWLSPEDIPSIRELVARLDVEP